ncbi:MAG: hypothetical protein AAFP89_15200 [Bacteroidota bacterium]
MSQIVRLILGFFLFLCLQIFLFNHMVLWQVAVPFVFVLYLLMLPMSISRPVHYILAFGMGLLVDLMSSYAAVGLHAFSAVLIVALRTPLVGFLSSSNYRGAEEVKLNQQNSIWLLTYLLPLIFIYQVAYFLLEDFSFIRIWYNLWKALLSSVYTFAVSYLIAYVFYKR